MSHWDAHELLQTGSDRKLALATALAAGACLLGLALPALFGHVYVADDLGEFHLPLRAFYAQQLERGEAFDWLPGLYGGFYVTGEGQVGGYHPWHRLLYGRLPLAAAFNLELLLSYPLLLAGSYCLLSRLIGRRDAAMFGALVFAFGGFSLLHFVHPNAVTIVAHLPWLLLAIDVALRSTSRGASALANAAVSLLLASQLLLGYPQYVWYTLLAAAAYVVWCVVVERVSFARVALLGWVATLAPLIAGVQLVPTFDALSGSVRQTADPTFAASGSLHPLNLVQWVAPYLFATRVVGQNTHELGLYVGAVPFLLCVRLFTQRSHWGRCRPLVVGLAVCGVAALLLAFGQHGGIYQLQAWLPVVSRFRFPCRAIVLVQACLAGGAAVGLALLLSTRIQRGVDNSGPTATSSAGSAALGGVVVLSVALALAAPWIWPEFVASPGLVWIGPVLLSVGAFCILAAERGARWAPAALVVLTAVDLVAYGASYAMLGRTMPLEKFVARSPRPPVSGMFRVATAPLGDGLRVGDRMLLAGQHRVDGYAGLEPAKRLDYGNPAVLRLAGTQWLWQPAGAQSDAEAVWTAIVDTAPRVRLVSQTAPAEQLASPESLGLSRAVLEPAQSLDASAVGVARVADDRPGRLTIDVAGHGRQVLVATESFHEGWQATQDGRPIPVVRVNGDFLGAVVERPGRVEFAFLPSSLWMGNIATWCGLSLWVLTLAIHLPLRRKQGRPCPAPQFATS